MGEGESRRESSRFQVKSGVRQGCPLSPWLFNIFTDRIVTEARKTSYGSVWLSTGQLEVLLFADDLYGGYKITKLKPHSSSLIPLLVVVICKTCHDCGNGT